MRRRVASPLFNWPPPPLYARWINARVISECSMHHRIISRPHSIVYAAIDSLSLSRDWVIYGWNRDRRLRHRAQRVYIYTLNLSALSCRSSFILFFLFFINKNKKKSLQFEVKYNKLVLSLAEILLQQRESKQLFCRGRTEWAGDALSQLKAGAFTLLHDDDQRREREDSRVDENWI